MPFSLDADLLRYEPDLFSVAFFANQTRLSLIDTVVTGSTLSSASANFVAAGITAGHVAYIEGSAYEVLERVDAGTLTISAVRADPADAAIPTAVNDADIPVTFRSFGPQAAIVDHTLLAALAIDPDDPTPDLLESEIVSVRRMNHLGCLGTLAVVFEAAATTDAEPEPLLAKAGHYREAFDRQLRTATILVRPGGEDATVEARQFRYARLNRI